MTNILMIKTMKEVMKEKRFKLIFLGEQLFIDMLSSKQAFNLITDKEIPDDSAVVGIHRDATRLGFLLRISSETFEPVPEGEMIPSLDISVKLSECTCNKA